MRRHVNVDNTTQQPNSTWERGKEDGGDNNEVQRDNTRGKGEEEESYNNWEGGAQSSTAGRHAGGLNHAILDNGWHSEAPDDRPLLSREGGTEKKEVVVVVEEEGGYNR